MPKWIQSFTVPSSSGHGDYTVSLAEDGSYGCSCPHWKFRRKTCRHITTVQEQGLATRRVSLSQRTTPTCRPANVQEVQKLSDDIILVPLIPLNNQHFLATVIVDLLAHGIPFEELKRRYHLPRTHSQASYTQLILSHGRTIYGDIDPVTEQRPLLTTPFWNLPEPILPGETAIQYERRTGCPQDIYRLALQAFPTPQAKPHTYTPPTPPPNRRRILTAE